MYTVEAYTSVTHLVENLIERENENIALYERAIHQIGDSLLKPVLLSVVQEKRKHREVLENELRELNEQFELDEAIV